MDRIKIDLDAWESAPCPIYTNEVEHIDQAEKMLYDDMKRIWGYSDAEIELYTKGEGNQFEREKFQERLCEEEEKVILIFGGIFYEDMIECVVCPDCGETMIVQHDIDNYRCLKCQNVFQMEEMV